MPGHEAEIYLCVIIWVLAVGCGDQHISDWRLSFAKSGFQLHFLPELMYHGEMSFLSFFNSRSLDTAQDKISGEEDLSFFRKALKKRKKFLIFCVIFSVVFGSAEFFTGGKFFADVIAALDIASYDEVVHVDVPKGDPYEKVFARILHTYIDPIDFQGLATVREGVYTINDPSYLSVVPDAKPGDTFRALEARYINSQDKHYGIVRTVFSRAVDPQSVTLSSVTLVSRKKRTVYVPKNEIAPVVVPESVPVAPEVKDVSEKKKDATENNAEASDKKSAPEEVKIEMKDEVKTDTKEVKSETKDEQKVVAPENKENKSDVKKDTVENGDGEVKKAEVPVSKNDVAPVTVPVAPVIPPATAPEAKDVVPDVKNNDSKEKAPEKTSSLLRTSMIIAAAKEGTPNESTPAAEKKAAPTETPAPVAPPPAAPTPTPAPAPATPVESVAPVVENPALAPVQTPAEPELTPAPEPSQVPSPTPVEPAPTVLAPVESTPVPVTVPLAAPDAPVVPVTPDVSTPVPAVEAPTLVESPVFTVSISPESFYIPSHVIVWGREVIAIFAIKDGLTYDVQLQNITAVGGVSGADGVVGNGSADGGGGGGSSSVPLLVLTPSDWGYTSLYDNYETSENEKNKDEKGIDKDQKKIDPSPVVPVEKEKIYRSPWERSEVAEREKVRGEKKKYLRSLFMSLGFSPEISRHFKTLTDGVYEVPTDFLQSPPPPYGDKLAVSDLTSDYIPEQKIFYSLVSFTHPIDTEHMSLSDFIVEDFTGVTYSPLVIYISRAHMEVVLIYQTPPEIRPQFLKMSDVVDEMDATWILKGYIAYAQFMNSYVNLTSTIDNRYQAYAGSDVTFSAPKLSFGTLSPYLASSSTIAVDVANTANLSPQCAILVFGGDMLQDAATGGASAATGGSAGGVIPVSAFTLLSLSPGRTPVPDATIQTMETQKNKRFIGFVYINDLELNATNANRTMYLNLSTQAGLSAGRYSSMLSVELFCPAV